MENITDVNDKSEQKKFFIATPTYDGKVHAHYMTSIVDLCGLLSNIGYEPMLNVASGGALLAANRNKMLQLFWNSGAEYLLFVDSDLGFNSMQILNLIQSKKDISGGLYPTRDGKKYNFIPDVEEDGRIKFCKETNLLKMLNIPAGFMLISRHGVEVLFNKFENLKYKDVIASNDIEDIHCIFNTELENGHFWGEDYTFCKRVHEAGLDIWIDPTIEFNHAGIIGRFLDILTDKKPE